MNVLLWRGWRPSFAEGVTFSHLDAVGIGGTEMQMLWHAQHLVAGGHHVQILGAAPVDTRERGVDFVGAVDRAAQDAAMRSGRVVRPDLVLLEGAYHAAEALKDRYPGVPIVHVGQNIDSLADRSAFAQARHVDLYAFVGLGHYADYCSRWPGLRHKFVLLRNAVPWREFHGRITPGPVEDKVAWVGAWTKKGLRTWFEVMEAVLRGRPTLRWVLFGPAYGSGAPVVPAHLLQGLRLPGDRVTCTSLPLEPLLRELAGCRAVLVSFGNECGPGSILDAHAMGRPVISGNDMVYKFANPEGTGLRAGSGPEARRCVDLLLDDHAAGDAMGRAGRRFVQAEYHEDRQREDLDRIVDYVGSGMVGRDVTLHRGRARWEERTRDLVDKAARRWRSLRCRG